MIATARLILRRWRPADAAPLAAICADPQVMQWLGRAPMDRDESDRFITGCETHFDAHGFGLWAVQRKSDGALIGVSGLRVINDTDHPMAPGIEIAWRQARNAWGQGYAREAAGAALRDGFLRHGLEDVVSYTARTNQRSQRVMQHIGMRRTPSRDFDHPALPQGHMLRPHHVYAINAWSWMQHLANSARCA